MSWIYDKAKPVSGSAKQAARQRQARLTKPFGSLGRLEEIAIQLAGLQDCGSPSIKHPGITVFAADHGVVEEGVSAFPQEVTVQMILNFARGGAAISVLARELGADFQIVNMGTVNDVPDKKKIRQLAVDKGTKNFCKEAAMSVQQLEQALDTGKMLIDEDQSNGIDIFIGGEMGIGNTTAATALSCAQMGKSANDLAGRGTGIDAAGLKRKIKTVEKALQLHQG